MFPTILYYLTQNIFPPPICQSMCYFPQNSKWPSFSKPHSPWITMRVWAHFEIVWWSSSYLPFLSFDFPISWEENGTEFLRLQCRSKSSGRPIKTDGWALPPHLLIQEVWGRIPGFASLTSRQWPQGYRLRDPTLWVIVLDNFRGLCSCSFNESVSLSQGSFGCKWQKLDSN